MNSIQTDKDGLKKTFSEYLKNRKLRHTAERDAIFKKVALAKEPFTLDTVHKQLEEENFHVSRASIYNTMELLLDAKIVVRRRFENGVVQYELRIAADEQVYLICTECNKVRKYRDESLDEFFKRYKTPKFYPEYFSLYFYGVCSRCKYCVNKDKKTKKKTIDKDEKS
jgi:Fur family ferric uptake transcriptional regulator